jgi:hypothetical protein
MIPPFVEPPPAPIKPVREHVFIDEGDDKDSDKNSNEDIEIAEILLSLSKPRVIIPVTNDSASESDGPTLSMRWSDVLKRKRSCFCEMDYDADSESDAESDAESESDYTVLRNGVKIPKLRFN